jgi:hypothetical protein
MDYAAANGMEIEDKYPYTGYDGDCQYDSTLAVNTISSHVLVTPLSPTALLAAVAQGPVSVAIEADSLVF